MTDSSPTPPPTDHEKQLLLEIVHAEYTCPHCKATVIKIERNELKFLRSHTFEVPDEKGDYLLLRIGHAQSGSDSQGDHVDPGGPVPRPE